MNLIDENGITEEGKYNLCMFALLSIGFSGFEAQDFIALNGVTKVYFDLTTMEKEDFIKHVSL